MVSSHLPLFSILSDIERHLAPLKQAIEQKDMLDKTIMQCVFIGIPRSGKSSLMKRMVGEDLPDISPSTGVADKSVQVIVRPSAAAVRESDSTWTKLKDNEEAAIVVMDTSRSHSHPVSDDPTPIMNTSQNDSHPVSDPTPVMNTSQTPLQAVSDNPTPILSKSRNHLHQVSNNPTTAAALHVCSLVSRLSPLGNEDSMYACMSNYTKRCV